MIKFFIYTAILFFVMAGSSFAQNKYLIYFKNKGVKSTKFLEKNTETFKLAGQHLSARSIKRRRKTMGENYLTFEDIPVNESYQKKISNLGIKIINRLKWFNAISAVLNGEQLNHVRELDFVKNVTKVTSIYFKKRRSFNKVKNSSKQQFQKVNYSHNYGPSLAQYELSDVPLVHDLGFSGQGIIIGMLDNGFRWRTHPALKNADVIAEYDFVFHDSVTSNQSNDVSDQDAHGTRTFSITGGFDEGQIIGPSFGAAFVLAKTEDNRSETHVEEDNYVAALEWMDSIGVDITTSSLGYNIFDNNQVSYTYEDMNGNTTIVTKAAELAFQRGILTINSAGNEGNNSWKFIIAPADGFNTLAIGAVNTSNQVASFSSRGPTFDGRIKPDVVADGVNVYGAIASTGGYSGANGTSFSAPITAGIAGQLFSAHPFITNVQARHILRVTAGNAESPNNDRGYGLVSASRAVSYPVFETVSNSYKVHKIFIDSVGIDPASISLHYAEEGNVSISNVSMTSINNVDFTYLFPQITKGKNINFWFDYKDSKGNGFREPLIGIYQWRDADDNVFTSLDESLMKLPKEFFLAQNYPNPFNGFSQIIFSVPLKSFVSIKVYDLLGRKVGTLVNENLKAGIHNVNISSDNLSSGVYFYQLKSKSTSITKKLIILK